MSSYDAPPPTKQSLVSWWKAFTKKTGSPNRSPPTPSKAQAPPQPPTQYKPVSRGLTEHEDGTERVFGVSLEQSLRYASVAISIIGPDGVPVVYGYVPIVVAKCGMMLKESATLTEGIFRVSGSSRRITQLQTLFDKPPRYGKDLDWTGYTVHDAASVLRRYLNMLPDPVIPANLYLDFTAVLAHDPPLPMAVALGSYKRLIQLLPPASRYLLLYLLDFLAVFARSSTKNLMPASNLATVFQPGLVSTGTHGQGALLGFPGFPKGELPRHLPGADRNGMQAGSSGAQAQGVAGEHGRGKEVLEFLIEQQAHFVLVGEQPVGEKEGREMDGTQSPRSNQHATKDNTRRERATGTTDSGYGAESTGLHTPTYASSALVGPSTNANAQASTSTSPPPQTPTHEQLIAESSSLQRRGSEKSVERRRLRKSHDGQGGKVKRSRTLPGRNSTGGGEGPLSRAAKHTEAAEGSPSRQGSTNPARLSPVQGRGGSIGTSPSASPNPSPNPDSGAFASAPGAGTGAGTVMGTGAGRAGVAGGASGGGRLGRTGSKKKAAGDRFTTDDVRRAVEEVGRA